MVLTFGWVAFMQGMKESYAKYRVHLLEHLKVDSAGGGAAEPKQGNGGRQAGRLLLLLLLGALLTIAYFVGLYFYSSPSLERNLNPPFPSCYARVVTTPNE